MSPIEFFLLVASGGAAAGFLGSITGSGGGSFMIPFLVLGLGVDLRYAIGASLVTITATSSGAAADYLKKGFTNFRIGMVLESATTIGALIGASIALLVSTSTIAVLFGTVLLYSAYQSNRPLSVRPASPSGDGPVARLALDSMYPTPKGPEPYRVRNLPFGYAMMFVAGTLSGLLGIGSGVFKVLAMYRIMGLPFKVSTTTSTFMIGVTAAASAGIYLGRGYIDPALALPVMLGVMTGSTLGSKVLARAQTRILRAVFRLVILALGIRIIYEGLTGGI